MANLWKQIWFGLKQPLVGEKRCVTTQITAAEETKTVDSACSEKKRKASQSKLRSFFSLEKRQKGESNAAGEEVQSELSTSINSKHRKSGFDPAWMKDFGSRLL